MGNDGDTDRAHRMILVEGVRNVVRGKNTSRRGSYRCLLENTRRNKEKPLLGGSDGKAESARSKEMNGRDRSVRQVPQVRQVPHDVEMKMVAHTAIDDGYQNYFRARTNRTPSLHNVVVMVRCSDHEGEGLLHNVMHLESLDAASYEKFETGSGARNRKTIQQLLEDEVCPEWDNPRTRSHHPGFVGLQNKVLPVFSCHNLLPWGETPCYHFRGSQVMQVDSDTTMSWFEEDNGSRCCLESKEGGEEDLPDGLDWNAAHCDVKSGGLCDSVKSHSGLLGVFPRVEGTAREDCTEKLVAHQDTMTHCCLADQKIQSCYKVQIDKGAAACNLREGGHHENAEEVGGHRNRRRNQNHAEPKKDVRLLESLWVARDAGLEIRFDPGLDVKVNR